MKLLVNLHRSKFLYSVQLLAAATVVLFTTGIEVASAQKMSKGPKTGTPKTFSLKRFLHQDPYSKKRQFTALSVDRPRETMDLHKTFEEEMPEILRDFEAVEPARDIIKQAGVERDKKLKSGSVDLRSWVNQREERVKIQKEYAQKIDTAYLQCRLLICPDLGEFLTTLDQSNAYGFDKPTLSEKQLTAIQSASEDSNAIDTQLVRLNRLDARLGGNPEILDRISGDKLDHLSEIREYRISLLSEGESSFSEDVAISLNWNYPRLEDAFFTYPSAFREKAKPYTEADFELQQRVMRDRYKKLILQTPEVQKYIEKLLKKDVTVENFKY